jgi:hypothetical protein
MSKFTQMTKAIAHYSPDKFRSAVLTKSESIILTYLTAFLFNSRWLKTKLFNN